MKLRYLLVFLTGVLPMAAQAAIYKTVDADGHVTYSSEPARGSKRIILEPASTSPSSSYSSSRTAPRQRSEYSTPRDFPRVDSATQRGRDDTRRKILEEELATEERLLVEARQNLKAGEASPEVFKGKDGKVYRNVAKHDEKMKALNDQVELHQNNVEALKTELSKLR